MNRQEAVKAFAIAAVALPTLLLGASMTVSSQTIVGQSGARPVPWTTLVSTLRLEVNDPVSCR